MFRLTTKAFLSFARFVICGQSLRITNKLFQTKGLAKVDKLCTYYLQFLKIEMSYNSTQQNFAKVFLA
jgi:hypothetical protein